MYRRKYLNGSFGGMLEFKRRMYVITPFPRPAFVPSPFPDLLSRLAHHLPSCTFLFRLSFFPHHFSVRPRQPFTPVRLRLLFPPPLFLLPARSTLPPSPCSLLSQPLSISATRDGFPSPSSLPTTASASPSLPPSTFFLAFRIFAR